MHLLLVGNNHTILEILCTLSEDKCDGKTDGLPMMDSLAWPIGSIYMYREGKLPHRNIHLTLSGILLLDACILFLGGAGGYRARWHRNGIFINHLKMGMYLATSFYMVECVSCFAIICFMCVGIFWDTGKIEDNFSLHDWDNHLPIFPR